MRVDLPLAFEHVRVLGRTGFVLGTFPGRTVVERIGVRVDGYQAQLGVDYAREHLSEVFIATGQLDIGPDLRPGIPEPHGVDITRIDKGFGRIAVSEMDRRIEGVRETVHEHPAELGILQEGRHFVDFRLDGLTAEQPVRFGRTLRNIVPGRVDGLFALNGRFGILILGRLATGDRHQAEGGSDNLGKGFHRYWLRKSSTFSVMTVESRTLPFGLMTYLVGIHFTPYASETCVSFHFLKPSES